MAPDTQGLLPEASEVESQGLGDTTPPYPTSLTDGSGQGEPAVQAPTDNAWAIAFKINVVITFLLAIYGLSFSHDIWRLLEAFGLHPSHILTTVLMAGFVMVPLTYGISWILLRSIIHCASWMLQVSAAIALLLCFGVVNTLFNVGMMLAASELTVVCGLITFLGICRRGSIEFAASNLKAVAHCVTSTPNTMFWALCMMAVRVVWYAATVMALITLSASALLQNGVLDTLDHTTATATEFACIFLLWELSAVWQFTLTGNVVAATVASSVSSWCSSPENVESVRESLGRVWRYSQGSFCKAAMVEVIITVILRFVGVWLINVGAPIFPVICLWLAARYAAQYTVLFVAMYRLGFSEGAGRALAILRTHGLTILINNTLIAASFSVLLAMVLFALILVLVAFSSSPMSPNHLTTAFCVVVLAAVAVTFEVVMNSFKAVFVYFIQDPEAFAEVHGVRDQDGVYRAWRRMQRVHPAVEEDEEGIEL